MNMPFIDYQISNSIAQIKIDRKGKKNALNSNILINGIRIINEIKQNPFINLLILSSTGDTFCSGLDLKEIKELKSKSCEANYEHAKYFQDFLKTIADLDILTIVKVNGSCYGGGIGLISVFDIVIAKNNIAFSLPEIDRGMPPAIIMPFVIKKIGIDKFKKVIFDKKNSFSGDKACELNLVDYIFQCNFFEQKFDEYIAAITKPNKLKSLISIKKLMKHYENDNSHYQAILNESLKKHLEYRKNMDLDI